MVITLIPGVGSDVMNGQPGRGIVAKVDGGDVTADQVRQTAKQMLQQQMQGQAARTCRCCCHFLRSAPPNNSSRDRH